MALVMKVAQHSGKAVKYSKSVQHVYKKALAKSVRFQFATG